jgi:hypothetical protein
VPPQAARSAAPSGAAPRATVPLDSACASAAASVARHGTSDSRAEPELVKPESAESSEPGEAAGQITVPRVAEEGGKTSDGAKVQAPSLDDLANTMAEIVRRCPPESESGGAG